MPRKISMGPALPINESVAFSSDKTGSDITAPWSRVPFGYGARIGFRNLVVALFLLPVAAAADGVTIAALGDSLTAGYGLPVADGFVPQMQVWMQNQGVEVTIINAGVSGDTTSGGLSRVDWTLTEDVDAMVVALGGNDLLRGIDPAISKANLRGILEAAEARGVEVLLIGVEAPAGNYGPDYASAFNGMYQTLSAEFEVPLVETWFQGLLAAARTQDRVRNYMQPDGIHPNLQGVAEIVADLGPEFIALVQSVE
jgi:acyl-CoA thioesterase-1